jgi:hypothetical protein
MRGNATRDGNKTRRALERIFVDYHALGMRYNIYMQAKQLAAVALLTALSIHGQQAKTPAEALQRNFDYINNKVLEMAEDFPADKYNYKLNPEMRTFGAVIVHIASGNIYAAKAGVGEKVKWDEEDPATYPTKAACVELLKKSIASANRAIKANPEGPDKNLQPFLSVLQHSSEHYGLLVAYYRANGLVPPESRPKK